MDTESSTIPTATGYFIPPKWPYCSWKTGDYRYDGPERNSNDSETLHESLGDCTDRGGTGLSLFFSKFSKDLRVGDDSTDKEINQEINEMMSAVAAKLQATNSLFDGCGLVKAGSVAEGTKISQMNEFDFLLVIDLFQKADMFHTILMDHCVVLCAIDNEENRQPLKRFPTLLSKCKICYVSQYGITDKMELEEITETPNTSESVDFKGTTQECEEGRDNEAEQLDGASYLETNSENVSVEGGNLEKMSVDLGNPVFKESPKEDTTLGKNADETRRRGTDEETEGAKSAESGDLNKRTQVIVFDDVRRSFLEPLIACIKQTLKPGWELLGAQDKMFAEPGAVCASDIAITLHLRCDIYDRDVDIDICPCIPLTFDQIRSARMHEDSSKKEQNIHFFCYVTCLMEEFNEMEVYGIMGENSQEGMIWGVPAVSTRITAPKLERSIFLHYGPDNGRVQTYRYAKCIASNFLPKITSFGGCKRCCHCVVKSYHLKNIVLFMFRNHTADDYWTESNVLNRTVEVFDILLQCIKDKDRRGEDSVAGISTFCTPGFLRLDCISTYNQFLNMERQKQRRSEFLFTQDSHKPMHELSFLPEYKESLQTGNEQVDREIRDYFEYLHEKHWDSYELVLKVSTLLHRLLEIKINTRSDT